MENTFLATLPPINEIDRADHEKLLDLMENKTRLQNQYLDTDLPTVINDIKIKWYGNRKLPGTDQDQFCVPETDYDTL